MSDSEDLELQGSGTVKLKYGPAAGFDEPSTCASLSARSVSLVSLTGSGGLSPAVVSVTAAMPCARNGACS